eukprot:TCONS_00035138-protein
MINSMHNCYGMAIRRLIIYKVRLITSGLNQLESLYFKVKDRPLKGRYNHLEKQYKAKRSRQEKASGIGALEETEAIQRLADIIQQFKDCETKASEEKDQKK